MFAETWAALAAAAADLIWPALGFAVLALAARGAAALRTARTASGEVRTNMILFVLDVIFVSPLLALLLAASGAFIQRNGLTLPTGLWSGLPNWLVIVIAVFVGDFVAYWRHRLEHSALLW